jgi:hypothetical protein
MERRRGERIAPCSEVSARVGAATIQDLDDDAKPVCGRIGERGGFVVARRKGERRPQPISASRA